MPWLHGCEYGRLRVPVEVDTCLSVIGGTDGKRAYYRQVAPIKDGVADINELEAVNAVVALHTFLDESDRGGHIKVLCDNQAAVEVFKNGRGHNRVILEAARAVWMIQAILQVKVTFIHIPGKDIVVPDNLSRAHLSDFYYARAMRDLKRHNLKFIYPEEYAFKLVFPLLRSRSGTPIAAGRRDPATEAGQGTRDQQEPRHGSPNVHRLLPICQIRPSPPSTYRGVPVHRIPGHPLPMSSHHLQHSGPHAPVPDTGRSAHRASLPSQGKTGPGWTRQNIYLCPTASAPGPTRIIQGGGTSPPAQRQRNTGARSNPDSVLRGHAQVGSVSPSIGTFDPRIHLTRADVTLHKTGVTITIRHAKNAQKYNQTQTRHIAKSPTALLCPWTALVAAVMQTPTRNPTDPMLMFPDRNPVTAAYVAAEWSNILTKVGAPPMFHRLHCLRKAAADAAYKAGGTIQEVKEFGA